MQCGPRNEISSFESEEQNEATKEMSDDDYESEEDENAKFYDAWDESFLESEDMKQVVIQGWNCVME